MSEREYMRKLTKTEVKHGFIYIDSYEFREAIPHGTKLDVVTPKGIYRLMLVVRRLGWSKSFFKDNKFHPNDTIALSKKGYKLFARKVSERQARV